ncbi:MAG TPA: class I SAM-dependent methyltransferase [Chitinophagaceae bacterium]|jgi:SAM-dependent methyltransferase|nr:class I SAM-dependent methyltransferase [Chitinophagaceae bacterium]
MQPTTENIPFSKPFTQTILTKNRTIYSFPLDQENIDMVTVESFGDEWQAFHGFEEQEIMKLGDEYFDIITPAMINDRTTVLEVGCGSGRFLKYLSRKAGFIVGVDPSHAVLAADDLLGVNEKVMLVKASANDLPFHPESFDFVYSIGVLHHIPDTFRAMQACVDKVKKGGYFFTYLYYDLDNRGFLFRTLFNASTLVRKGVSRLPGKAKRAVCNLLAVGFYMPFVGLSRLLKMAGVGESVRSKIPLYGYENKSFYIIRNDALDRFGTPLEQRFTKAQIRDMMERCGLEDITFSNNIPYWHVVGKKK